MKENTILRDDVMKDEMGKNLTLVKYSTYPRRKQMKC